MSRLRTFRRQRAFTLVQLLVLLGLLPLILGLLVVAVSRARDAANRAQSQNNLKQIVLATIATADGYNGKMPPGPEGFYPGPPNAPSNGYGPCLFHILPNMDQKPLYDSSRVGSQFAAWQVAGIAVQTFSPEHDPTVDPTSDRTSYLANSLAMSTPFGQNVRYPAHFTDGTGQTIFSAEGYSQATDRFALNGKKYDWQTVRRWWDNPVWHPVADHISFQVAPRPEQARSDIPQGLSTAGLQVAMGDGSVRSVFETCSAITFYAACTPHGEEVLGEDW